MKYINKKLYSDIESYKVYSIDYEKGTARARRVKRDFKPIWEDTFCINLMDQYNAPVIVDNEHNSFPIRRRQNGVWGRWVKDRYYCWDLNSLTQESIEAQLKVPGSFIEKTADGKKCLCVYRVTKSGKIGHRFEVLGELEDTCRAFYDYNF